MGGIQAGEMRVGETQSTGARPGRTPVPHREKHLPAPQSALPWAGEKHGPTAGALRAGQPLPSVAAVGGHRRGLSGAPRQKSLEKRPGKTAAEPRKLRPLRGIRNARNCQR